MTNFLLKVNKTYLSLIFVILALATIFFLVGFNDDNLIPLQAKGEIKEAYLFALEHGDILEQVPCYCGCYRSGHQHNRHCFYDDNGQLDNHGLNCGVCVDIALTTKEMYSEGLTIEEIGEYLSDKYRGFIPTGGAYN